MQTSFWACIRMEHEAAYTENKWRHLHEQRLLPNAFKAGDLAYISGSINGCFAELLEDRGYQLVGDETIQYDQKGRYCLVLRQLRGDRYLVCYLTTFGGVKVPQEITSPVGRYFALPIGTLDHWPGVPSLKTRPPWSPEAFVMGIPVARDGLQRSNLPVRYRLFPSELERAKHMIRDKLAKFEQDCHWLRQQNLYYQAKLRQGNQSPHEDTEDFWTLATQQIAIAGTPSKLPDEDIVESATLTNDNFQCPPISWLTPPMVHNNVTWLLRYQTFDIKSRSLYLNTINAKTTTRPSFATLPKPFFAPSLRTNAANIMRLIR